MPDNTNYVQRVIFCNSPMEKSELKNSKFYIFSTCIECHIRLLSYTLPRLCFKKLCFNINADKLRRQRGSVVRVGDLNAEDMGSNSRLGLLNEFVLGDIRGKFTTLSK